MYMHLVAIVEVQSKASKASKALDIHTRTPVRGHIRDMYIHMC